MSTTTYFHRSSTGEAPHYGAVLANSDGTGACWGQYLQWLPRDTTPGQVVKHPIFDQMKSPHIGKGYLHQGTYSDAPVDITTDASPDQIKDLKSQTYEKMGN